MDQKLTQKTSQALIISKQMQQSLKILQMTSVELAQYLENEAQENPFLEVEAESQSDLAREMGSEDLDVSNYWQEDGYLRYEDRGVGGEVSENFHQAQVTLKDHIVEQINIVFREGRRRNIALYLADMLDEDGYMREDLSEIAEQIKIQQSDIEEVLNELKTFDPVGVFASGLAECLSIQVRDADPQNQSLLSLIQHLELLARGEAKKLCKVLSIDEQALADLVGQLKKFDPKPARNFGAESLRDKIPDAIIFKNSDGVFEARLNSRSLPSIVVNNTYFERIYSQAKGGEEKKFCANKLSNANWLMRSVAQRSETILKVVGKICEEQSEFLQFGLDYLKPMTLTDIAKKVSLHESTLSRISNKFVATPFGVFELKFFFSNSLSSNVSENLISTRAVKSRIKELVDNESKTKEVLSDDELASKLGDLGIAISRRTVAKYRDMLRIEPSHIRKRKMAVCAA